MTAATLTEATEQRIAAKVRDFVQMVAMGRSYTAAWDHVTSNSTFGPALLADLSARCVAAANAAIAKAAA